MRIVITGPKGTGKSTISRKLSDLTQLSVLEIDNLIEQLYKSEHGSSKNCRQICADHGEPFFRELETRAVQRAAEHDWCIVATGGSTLKSSENRRILRPDSILVALHAEIDTLWERITRRGTPSYLTSEDPKGEYTERMQHLYEIVEPCADVVAISTNDRTAEDIAEEVYQKLCDLLAVRNASCFSQTGECIHVSTFGESHGPAIGAVLDGLPAGVPVSEEWIQEQLDRRRPGQSAVATPREEADQVEILSGVFEGKSTGAPIALLIRNRRQRSRDYTPFKDIFRPGHADFTFWQKYGIRDYKGGGRSSGRETAGRVASGAIARKILEDNGVKIRAFALEIGGVRAETLDLAEIEKNPVRTPDAQAAERMKQAILDAKEANNSVGGIVQLQVTGLPAGLGDPVFGKLDARLGGALLSIGAIKGFEVGDGFEVAQKTGRENNDEMKDGKFLTNHCGGVLGGISTGEPVVIRLAFKPTASISQVQQASDIHGANHELIVEGRHDPCIIPRAIPVVESMTALCLLDVWEIQARLKRISSCFDMFKTDA